MTLGLTAVSKPGKTFDPLGNNMATPAAVDGSLILRTDEGLYCGGGAEKP